MIKNLNKYKWIKWLMIVLIILLICEIILRYFFGLGHLPVYVKSDRYEYFYAPNQSINRFGNKIITNEFGMRSGKVNKRKKVILEFGDSILNGGSHVDNNDLATFIEENELNKIYDNQYQILNISAQSWGVSNAFAFLKEHGDFNAEIILLVFSSHDLHDNMHFRDVVGIHSAWPDEQPLLALSDLLSRYIFPKVKQFVGLSGEFDYLKGFDDSKINPGWQNFFSYCKIRNIPLIVYLHASKKELEDCKYDHRGNQIIQMCKSNNVILITDLSAMKKSQKAYIDDMHLNKEGHQIMSKLVLKTLIPLVSIIRQNSAL